MINQLLPACVAAVEMRGAGPIDGSCLFPEEAAVVARAVEARRREFAAVRVCARAAMAALGIPPQPVLPDEHRAPSWPEGVVGAMTHCEGYHAAALAHSSDLVSLGIDAEPHDRLPPRVLDIVSLPEERTRLNELADRDSDVRWDRLLFTAKEAVYKAWFPLTRRWLDFAQADVELDRDAGAEASGRVRARLLVPGPVVGGRTRQVIEGRWAVRDGIVACAVTVPHDAAG